MQAATDNFAGSAPPEIHTLISLSARLGMNPLLVQGGAGNTSVKIDGVLWIKASGKWLSRADREEILVPVDLDEVRSCIRHRQNCNTSHTSPCGARLAPSIETTMHAVVPRRVTIHVHSLNTIAWAVRDDGPEQLKRLLAGLRWQWIPYTPSGLPLALEVQQAFARSPEAEVLVLANHGLVVCGETCESAEAILRELESRVLITPRHAPPPNIAQLQAVMDTAEWRLPDAPALHASALHGLGTDPITRAILAGRILYPCQAIFLGPALPLLAPRTPASTAAELYAHTHGVQPVFFAVEGAGVIVRRNITRAEMETLVGLANVVQRIEPSAPLRYLTCAELASLMQAEAQQYRQLVENQPSRVAES